MSDRPKDAIPLAASLVPGYGTRLRSPNDVKAPAAGTSGTPDPPLECDDAGTDPMCPSQTSAEDDRYSPDGVDLRSRGSTTGRAPPGDEKNKGNSRSTKTTLYLTDLDNQRIQTVRFMGKYEIKTRTKVIREALRLATLPPASSESIGFEILKWAENLAFMSPKEKGQLWDFSKRLYDLARREPEE